MEPFFSQEIYDLYENTNIPLAVYYVENGRFWTMIVSRGVCKMYESTKEEMLERLNGKDPFVNIVEKEEMLQAVKIFSDNDESYNVVFHEYIGRDRKLKTIHGIGNHEYTEDGRRYSVIRYDEISDSSRRMLFPEEEQWIADQQKLLNDIYDAIARSFTSVIYIDLSDLSVNVIRLNDLGKKFMSGFTGKNCLRDVMDAYVKTFVFEEDAAEVLRYGDIDHVQKLLDRTESIYHTYRTVREGRIVYYRLKIAPFDNGKKIIYGFELFDDQVRAEKKIQSERELQMALLAGLSCEYESIWIADAAIHHAKLIRSNMGSTESSTVMNRLREGRYETIINNYIERYVVPEDRERVRLMTSIDNLMENTRDDEIYYVNYCRINPEGSKNYLQLSIMRVTDDTGEVRFVCGFRNIDAIIEEEKLKQLLYRMAHIDSMTEVNNRRSFDEFMDHSDEFDLTEEAVFFSFDLNDLKKANDSCGHEAGDELIKGAAGCMKEILGKYGNIYRTGGDEFVVIADLPVQSRDTIIKQLEDRFESWKGSLYPSLSISTGYVCASDDPSMTLEDMRRKAERIMYDQKERYHMLTGNDNSRS